MNLKTILVAALVLRVSSPAFGFTVRSTASGEPIRWPENGKAIFYLVNSLDGSVQGRKVEALDKAFHLWERSSLGNIRFVFAGDSETRRASRDGTNLLVWIKEDWNHSPEAAALATTWYCPETGLIEEVDIEFNARDYRWSTDGEENALDLKSVALHEIGHLLGLGHSFDPAAAMHDAISPHPRFSRSLSRDDLEGLGLLYPPATPHLLIYDLPVLLYPDSFSQEKTFARLPAPALTPDAWITSLASFSAGGEGSASNLVIVSLDQEGRYRVEAAGRPLEGEVPKAVCPASEPVLSARILGAAGLDLSRAGSRGEVVLLGREEEGESIFVYRPIPGEPFPDEPLLSLTVAPFFPADNFLGMAALDASGNGFSDELAVLRAAGEGFSLAIYSLPREGESFQQPLQSTDQFAVRVKKGSRLLGLAVLDASGSGGEELVVLEQTLEGVFRLHSYRVIPPGEGKNMGVRHLSSAVLPGITGEVLPAQITGVDAHGDGFFNDLAILNRQP